MDSGSVYICALTEVLLFGAQRYLYVGVPNVVCFFINAENVLTDQWDSVVKLKSSLELCFKKMLMCHPGANT